MTGAFSLAVNGNKRWFPEIPTPSPLMSRFISGYKMTVLNTSNEKMKIIFLFADGTRRAVGCHFVWHDVAVTKWLKEQSLNLGTVTFLRIYCNNISA